MKAREQQIFWVAMPVMRNLILLAAKNEIEVEAICKAGNIARVDLDNIEMKVSFETNLAVMEAMLQISKDKDMGLHLGEKATPPIIGQAGYLQQSSSDVLTAFKATMVFYKTFTALYEFRLEEKEELIYLYFEPIQIWNDVAPETARHGVDIPFAATLNFIKVLSAQMIFPTEVLYRYPKVNDTVEHERIFRCKPLFNQPCNRIAFNKSELMIPVLGYNPQLNAMIEKSLRERLRQSEEGFHFTTKVREAISTNYHFDFPQIENIALALNITPRTLQRKLQEENTNYRELSDTIKFELASTLLKYNELTISEIAYKLGYADRSSFQRAFRQWTGKTPGDFRIKE